MPDLRRAVAGVLSLAALSAMAQDGGRSGIGDCGLPARDRVLAAVCDDPGPGLRSRHDALDALLAGAEDERRGAEQARWLGERARLDPVDTGRLRGHYDRRLWPLAAARALRDPAWAGGVWASADGRTRLLLVPVDHAPPHADLVVEGRNAAQTRISGPLAERATGMAWELPDCEVRITPDPTSAAVRLVRFGACRGTSPGRRFDRRAPIPEQAFLTRVADAATMPPESEGPSHAPHP